MSVNRPAKCRFCKRMVVFLRSPFTGERRKFDARPVDPRTHNGPPAYPVDGDRAWKVPELVGDLQVRRETSEEHARAEVYDMPWYVPHSCPNNPFAADSAPVERTDP